MLHWRTAPQAPLQTFIQYSMIAGDNLHIPVGLGSIANRTCKGAKIPNTYIDLLLFVEINILY